MDHLPALDFAHRKTWEEYSREQIMKLAQFQQTELTISTTPPILNSPSFSSSFILNQQFSDCDQSDSFIDDESNQVSILSTLFPTNNYNSKVVSTEVTPASNTTSNLKRNDQEMEALKLVISDLQSKNKDLIKENAAKTAIINKHSLQENINDQQLQFDKYKEAELQKLARSKQEHEKSLKAERLYWERTKKAQLLFPNKKDRQEVEDLKKRIVDISNQHNQKEVKLLGTQDRLKSRIDLLEQRNAELVQEVKLLEQSRASFLEEKTELQTVVSSLLSERKLIQKHQEKFLHSPAPIFNDKSISVGGLAGADDFHSDFSSNKAIRNFEQDDEEPMHEENMECKDQDCEENVPASIRSLDALEKQLGLSTCIKEKVYTDGKRERQYPNKLQLTWYRNGTTKELVGDGTYIIRFLNGDYKKVSPDKTTVYWFSENNTLQTTLPSSTIVYEFSNGQTEKLHANGEYEITFPDGTFKKILGDGSELSTFPDGTIQKIDPDGQKIIEYFDGTKEYFLKGLNKKVKKDGTITIKYNDGSQEMRYTDGVVEINGVVAAS